VTVKPCYEIWSRYSEVEGKDRSLEIGTCAEKNKGNILSTDSGVCAVVIPRGALPMFELVTGV
jgi:hypothetical protein